jgi:hypothetical protein
MGYSDLIVRNPLIQIPCRADLEKLFAEKGLADVARSIKIYESFATTHQKSIMHALSILSGVDACFEAWAILNHESSHFDQFRGRKGDCIRVLCAQNSHWLAFAQEKQLFENVHCANIYD